MKELIWQRAFAENWAERARQNRLPHAVMLIGPPGVGKRAAASWIVERQLKIGSTGDLPVHPAETPEHADLHWISPPEDKQAIGIEQIRALVGELTLTSYEGHGKAAVIEPANAMTVAAANSLLKTLEEPPGDALLILVADRTGKLPATIFSRCQRIDFPVPAEDVSLTWLDQLQPGAQWHAALQAAGGAPVGAIAALEELDTAASLGQDLNVLGSGRGSAVETAARWAKLDAQFVLNWLSQQIKLAIRSQYGGADSSPGLVIEQSVLQRMDSRNLLCYLDIINRLRGQAGGSYNVQLTFEGLLIDWAGGLAECEIRPPVDGMSLMLADNRQSARR